MHYEKVCHWWSQAVAGEWPHQRHNTMTTSPSMRRLRNRTQRADEWAREGVPTLPSFMARYGGVSLLWSSSSYTVSCEWKAIVNHVRAVFMSPELGSQRWTLRPRLYTLDRGLCIPKNSPLFGGRMWGRKFNNHQISNWPSTIQTFFDLLQCK